MFGDEPLIIFGDLPPIEVNTEPASEGDFDVTPPSPPRAPSPWRPPYLPLSKSPIPLTPDVTQEELSRSDPEPIYRSSLAYWEQGYRPQNHPHHIEENKRGSTWLIPDKVYPAIASVIYARPDQFAIIDLAAMHEYYHINDHPLAGTERDYGPDFRRVTIHNERTGERREKWPVTGGSTVIIPWRGHKHWVVVMIRPGEIRGPPENPFKEWTFVYWDTIDFYSPDHKQDILSGVRQLLTDMGWFERWGVDSTCLLNDGEMLSVWPQDQKGPTCSIHTVMNAWALALGFELNDKFDPSLTKKRSDRELEVLFSEEAAHMMNLASVGRMNSKTIYLFLKFWGFIQQDSWCPENFAVARTVDVASGWNQCDAVYRAMVGAAE